jgi:rSAM/selenodomain-associated transferase 1
VTERLLIFTRLPVAGQVKTRLIPALGAAGAAALHQRMAERTLATARSFARCRQTGLEVWYTGGNVRSAREWLGDAVGYHRQPAGDLGQRMALTFAKSFATKARHVVLVGTDCPHLSEEILAQAFAALLLVDVVLGPAEDGGYYLVGLGQEQSWLFTDIAWGTGLVLEQTLAAIVRRGASYQLLPCLADVDRPDDLALWPG